MEINVIDRFSTKNILVIGDIMVDKYLYGETSRISPEAPVPVTRISREECVPGGSANTANNIVSLGASVSICGVIGNDESGRMLKKMLDEKNIDHSLLIVDDERPTTVKQRVVSGNNHQLIRLDFEKTSSLSEKTNKEMIEKIKKKIDNYDAIVMSDYSKGVFSEELAQKIIQMAKDKPVVVDSKTKNILFFKGSTLITPNLKEAMEMTGKEEIVEMGRSLAKKIRSNVFITRGAEGISVFDKKGSHTHVPQMQIAKVFDVTGAGDTVAAVSALGMACGAELVNIAKLANFAGGLVVQKPGTSVVTPEEMKSIFRHEISHYLNESIEVKQRVIDHQIDKIEKAAHMFIEAYKNKKKVIAFGNGGSASDAQHLVGELVGRFKIERKGLPAVALTTDSSVVTAIANDYGYERVFERQVEANASKGDVLFGISTSGNSPNVLNAIKKAKEIGCKTIGLTGKKGGELAKICDISIVVPSDNTPRIQEAHIAIIHIICELLDKQLAKNE